MDDHKAPPGPVRADTLMQRVGDWFYATRDHWKRGVLMLLYILAFSLIRLAVILIAIFQFGYILFSELVNPLVGLLHQALRCPGCRVDDLRQLHGSHD